METQMLRYMINRLEKIEKLKVINNEVKKDYEIGHILSQFNNKQPCLFNNLDHKNSVIGGLFGNRDLFFSLLKFEHDERIKNISKAIIDPIDYELIETGPIYENHITGRINLKEIIPFTRFHEKDSSAFITSGILVIKDPESGKFLTSIRRLQYNGDNKLSLLVASSRLNKIIKDSMDKNEDIEVAVFLGYDAETCLASQVNSNIFDIDKYKVDSALRKEPIKLVRGKSTNLLIPAYCEIALEGRIKANKYEYEGPFGELMGYYGNKALHPIIEIDSVMHRNNPIYQIAFPCREEHLTNGLTREIELYSNLSRLVDVHDLYITEGGGYRFNAVISINKNNLGDGKTCILGAFGTFSDLKNVVVVDSDVDIFSPSDVEWAITTRSQASIDNVVINGANGSTLEPTHVDRGVTDKFGIDATRPEPENSLYHRAKIGEF